MEKIGIVTDSCSGITLDDATKLNIGVVAMPFTINNNHYLEGVDLSQEEFY